MKTVAVKMLDCHFDHYKNGFDRNGSPHSLDSQLKA